MESPRQRLAARDDSAPADARAYQEASIGLCYFDTDLRYVRINDWLARINGIAVGEHLGRRIGEVLPTIAAGVESQLRQVIETGESIIRGSAYLETAAHPGTRRHYEHSFHPDMAEGGTVVGVCCVVEDVTELVRTEEALSRSEERRRALGARLAEVNEMERRRLVRELHDQVGQSLTAVGINLTYVRGELPADSPPAALRKLDEAIREIEDVTGRVRGVMSDLRPPVLDDHGLVAALRWYGKRVEQQAHFKVTVNPGEGAVRLSSEQETALFRIAQEALTNVLKHSGAREVTITLEDTGEGVSLTIADDGAGFDPATLSGEAGWGHLIMRERAGAVGGEMRLESAVGQGTRVIVQLQGD